MNLNKNSIFILNVILTLCFIVCSSCSRRPKGVLSENEMVQLMADLEIAEAYLLNGNPAKLPDSVTSHISEAVLARRGITYAQVDSSFKWYGKNLDNYYDLHDKVVKEIAKRTRKAGGAVEEDLGVRNLWRFPDHTFFAKNSLSDGLKFSLSNPDLAKGENLEWITRLSSPTDSKMFLGVEYTDGTASLSVSSNYGQNNLKCELIIDTAKQVKRIFGNIRINNNNTPLWADSIRLIKNPFDSITYYKINNQLSVKY